MRYSVAADGDALMLCIPVQFIYINIVHCFQPFMLDQKMVLRLPYIHLLKINNKHTVLPKLIKYFEIMLEVDILADMAGARDGT